MKRRIFLRGAGGAALAAPFLSSVAERTAKAQSTAVDVPKRLAIFFTHNGCLTNRWFPAVENGALTPADLESTTLKDLASLSEKIMIPRGMRSMNSYAVGQTIDPHDQAMGSKLTCAPIIDDSSRYASARSLDHIIADQINPNGASPLVLSVGSSSANIKEVMSFSGPGVAYPGTSNPTTIYNQLTEMFSTGGQQTEADYRVMRGESIIDLVSSDLEAYERLTMSLADQTRISDWKELLRSTEIQISTACTADAAGVIGINQAAVEAASEGGFGAGQGTAFTLGGDMMMNLMALNMICDANRVMILAYPGYTKFDWDGIVHDADHHGLSHRNGSFAVGGECFPGVIDMIAEIDAWYASKYARMVNLFDSITEGEGSLLDNCAAVWIPELSDGNAHNLNNLPIVQAGSCGGYFKMGQAISVTTNTGGAGNSEGDCTNGDTSVGFGTGSNGGNAPINKYYVALMNALGCTDEAGGKVTEFGVMDGTSAEPGISDPGEFEQLVATT